MSRGPWTITIADALGETFRLHHRRNYVPEVHELHDLIQLARLVRRVERWAKPGSKGR